MSGMVCEKCLGMMEPETEEGIKITSTIDYKFTCDGCGFVMAHNDQRGVLEAYPSPYGELHITDGEELA